MIRRKNMTSFLDANESTYVSELKKMVRGITKKDVDDIKLLKDREVHCWYSHGLSHLCISQFTIV